MQIDDLPYESPLGDEQPYLVKGRISGLRGLYMVVVAARSNRDAAYAFDRWSMTHFKRHAISLLSIGSLAIHQALMNDDSGDWTEQQREQRREQLDQDDALYQQGIGAFLNDVD